MRLSLTIAGLLLSAPLAAAQPARAEAIGPAAGTGGTPAIAEARADAPGYTIYRPQDPGGAMPLVLWGNGGCRDNGLSASHFLREVASHGYIVVANGRPAREYPADQSAHAAPPETPRGAGHPPPPAADETSVAQLLGAIGWAASANARRDDPLFGRIDTTRIAVMGHSCGGLQALAAGADSRITTVIAFASGVYNRGEGGLSRVAIAKGDLRRLHTPVAYILGGPGDIAYPNGMDDVARITHVPVFAGNLPVGHGGTFQDANGGDWARVAVAWLDWQLKHDRAAGTWFVGEQCRLCTTYGWTVQRNQFPQVP